MDVAKPTRIRPVITKSSMAADDPNLLHEIVRDKRNDCPRKTNKRKLSDRQKADDQNQAEVEENCSDSEPDIVNDAEIEAMFDKVRRRKKTAEKNPQDMGLLVEKVMALMEVAAEEDIEFNRQNKPAIKKIQTLPLLTDFLSKKHLQQEFMDRGVLSLFKIWLEPLPDGSLPNATVRAWLLNLLTHTFPIDVSRENRREQLKKSGLDLRNAEEKVAMPKKKTSPPVKKESAMQVWESDLDLEPSPKQPCSNARTRSGVSVPEAAPCVYSVIPRTKSKPDAQVERARVRYTAQRECKIYKKIEKGIRRMKNSNKKTVYKPFSTCKAPIC
ncbi:hypothetical protein V6N11_070398 [Hibiscus sabdariffa]|uniref:TFIIS N-terminal domain-containing protein n=1 Tax=Hibiscus sabdariffa TaxID=183260 RepID=A0ABR2QEZ3_9ROSI